MVQTHPPSEVVVSDNVADSATAAVVASFASRSNFPVRLHPLPVPQFAG
jgi:hypothetical protein